MAYIYDKEISLIKNFEAKQFANEKFLVNKTVETNNGTFSLKVLSEFKKEKDRAFLFNKLNVYKNELNNKDLFFITLTLKPVYRASFVKAKDENKLEKFKQLKNIFQDFFDALHKDRLFRELTKDKRNYVRSTECHKTGVPHEHISYYVAKEYSERFLKVLVHIIKKHKKIGRTEIVINKDNLRIVEDIATYSSKVDAHVLNTDLKNIDTGAFVYFKTLKHKAKDLNNNEVSENESIMRYTLKYILKEIMNNKEDVTGCKKNVKENYKKALYSFSKVRKVSYSRFIFARFLYDNLVQAGTKNYISKEYSLQYLTNLKNNEGYEVREENGHKYYYINNKVYVHAKNFEKRNREILQNSSNFIEEDIDFN